MFWLNLTSLSKKIFLKVKSSDDWMSSDNFDVHFPKSKLHCLYSLQKDKNIKLIFH